MRKPSKKRKSEPTRVKNPFAEEIGERLVLARDAAGYDQVKLAGDLKISPSQLSNYENGWTVLPPHILIKIYALTRINSDWLYLADPSRLPADIKEKISQAARYRMA